MMNINSYRALVSSDWNECLSPSRPFDPLVFLFPELEDRLKEIFLAYTSNQISYARALELIKQMMPGPISRGDMDKYLYEKFSLYPGADEFIKWCRENQVLFMINTTGWIGYFQRAIQLKLIPPVDYISASPFIEFSESLNLSFLYLYDIYDKPVNTKKVMDKFKIKNVFLIGDSGGDGPHFEWGKKNNCVLIGCMTKPSLKSYCEKKGFSIDYFVGNSEDRELILDVNELIYIIENNITS